MSQFLCHTSYCLVVTEIPIENLLVGGKAELWFVLFDLFKHKCEAKIQQEWWFHPLDTKAKYSSFVRRKERHHFVSVWDVVGTFSVSYLNSGTQGLHFSCWLLFLSWVYSIYAELLWLDPKPAQKDKIFSENFFLTLMPVVSLHKEFAMI